jgi:hypothetical protein
MLSRYWFSFSIVKVVAMAVSESGKFRSDNVNRCSRQMAACWDGDCLQWAHGTVNNPEHTGWTPPYQPPTHSVFSLNYLTNKLYLAKSSGHGCPKSYP